MTESCRTYECVMSQTDIRQELTEVARANNFLIKYDKYDWNLNLTRACSEAAGQPGLYVWSCVLILYLFLFLGVVVVVCVCMCKCVCVSVRTF